MSLLFQISPPAVDVSPWGFLTLLMLLTLIAGTTMGILFSILAGKQHARLIEKERVEVLKKVQVESIAGKDVYECPHCKWLTPSPSMKHDYKNDLIYTICPECKKPYEPREFDFLLVKAGSGYVRSYVQAMMGEITHVQFEAAKKSFARDIGNLIAKYRKRDGHEKVKPEEPAPIPVSSEQVKPQVEVKTSPAA